MGRVSLTESYDDRSVIAKLNEMDKRVTENTTVVTAAEASAQASAAAAQETADRFAGSVGAVVQNANAQINASKAQVDQAKAEVDETVTTVAQAVQTANNASASAQQSAQTVAGYDDRLTAAETKNTQQDTAISALQTADTNNVKLDSTQTITGNKTFTKTMFTKRNFNFDATAGDQWGGEIQMNSETTRVGVIENFVSKGNLDLQLFSQNPISNKYGSMGIHLSRDGKTNYCFGFNPSADAPSNAFTTKAYVESTDGATNNLVHRTANETITGTKTLTSQYGTTSIGLKGLNSDVTAQSYQASIPRIGAYDKNDEQLWQLETAINADGTVSLNCRIRNSDGTVKTVTLAKGDVKQ